MRGERTTSPTTDTKQGGWESERDIFKLYGHFCLIHNFLCSFISPKSLIYSPAPITNKEQAIFFAWTGLCTKTVFFRYIVKDKGIFFKLELTACTLIFQKLLQFQLSYRHWLVRDLYISVYKLRVHLSSCHLHFYYLSGSLLTQAPTPEEEKSRRLIET